MIDEPENIETLEDVIKQLEYHRQIHIGWVEWYKKYPDDKEHEYAGDSEHHAHVISRYDKMIELIGISVIK